MRFPVSGVECSPWMPPLVSFVIATLSAPAGVSGAFLLLPFQMSVLGFTSPGVSPTNLIYNIVAIPGGLWRYARERRMCWPLAVMIVIGTLPGVFLGAVARIRWLPDARGTKLFVGCVLAVLAARLFSQAGARERSAGRCLPGSVVRTTAISSRRIEYEFGGATYGFHPAVVLALSLAVGFVGGVYGIGGGAIIAPFLVAVLGLPIYTVAGAALLGTFVTSLAGVACFELLGLTSLGAAAQVRPDWALGVLFGLGGLAGTYAGARLQRYLPALWIRLLLASLAAALALAYIGQFFL